VLGSLGSVPAHVSGILDRPVDINLDSAPQRLEYERIVARIVGDAPGSILDWGTGHGQIAAALQTRGLDVTAFDYDPDVSEPITRPLDRFPAIVSHLSSDPVALPFEDDAFDAVLSCGVLEHVADPAGSLDEIHRILRPGGTLYVYKLPNRHSYLEWIAKRLGLYYHGKLPHDTLYTLRSAVELVASHGYAVTEARLANMLPLTVRGTVADRLARPIFEGGRQLARVPALNRLATNVELVATAVGPAGRAPGSSSRA